MATLMAMGLIERRNMMRHEHVFALAGLLACVGPAQAQMPNGHWHGGHTHPASPYTGFEQRQIKALSDQQIADLWAGRGMGLALAAELNSYPGPLHVLEIADALALSEDQRTRTKALYDEMKAKTIPLGEQIIGEEATLDRLFAERRITPEALAAATSRIGALQGELRALHLRYHLTVHSLLTADQIARYDERRGYGRSR
jgi:hypothetical protein